MGKRKSRSKPAPRKKMPKLDTKFCCPFCNHDGSVECKIDMKLGIGKAVCAICKASYGTKVTSLSEPIDLYTEWLDECENVNADAVEDESWYPLLGGWAIMKESAVLMPPLV